MAKEKIWITQGGEKIPYGLLRNNHLVNILAWLERDDLTDDYDYEGLLEEESRRARTTKAPLCRKNGCCRIVKTNGMGSSGMLNRDGFCRKHKDCDNCTVTPSYPLDKKNNSWYARFTSIRSAQ